MITRDDLHGLTEAPQSHKDFLERIGGKNPYGEPIFRLVLAQNRYHKAAGEWNEWPDHYDVNERGGLGIGDIHRLKEAGGTAEEAEEMLKAALARRPDRVVRGMVEVEKYTDEGWIIERWYPAHCYGSREHWNSFGFDGHPSLGPYPQYGDYEMISGTSDRLPSLERMREVVREHFHELETRNPNPAQRMLMRLHELEERRSKAHRRAVAKIDDRYRELDKLRNRLSLGAGRVMNKLAEAAGIRSHMGA